MVVMSIKRLRYDSMTLVNISKSQNVTRMLQKVLKMDPNFAHDSEQYFNNFMDVVSSLGTGKAK